MVTRVRILSVYERRPDKRGNLSPGVGELAPHRTAFRGDVEFSLLPKFCATRPINIAEGNQFLFGRTLPRVRYAVPLAYALTQGGGDNTATRVNQISRSRGRCPRRR